MNKLRVKGSAIDAIFHIFVSRPSGVMSQAYIDAFLDSAFDDTLTPQGVTTAVARGIPVNVRQSYSYSCGHTALHCAVIHKRREMVVALLAAGADANMTSLFGRTSVWHAAMDGTADILQLLIDGGGSVKEPRNDGCTSRNDGCTPLIALILWNKGDAAARLEVLLACPELDLDAEYEGKTAEQWAVDRGHVELALAIAQERARRGRWSALRVAWIVATSASLMAL